MHTTPLSTARQLWSAIRDSYELPPDDYQHRIELENGPIDVRIDERMYRVSDNIVINESKMRQFGIGVGDILLTLIRHPEIEANCSSV